MDVRTLEICNRFTQLPDSYTVTTMTGLKFSPFFSVFKMIWLMENVKSVKRASAENDLVFLTVDSWILSVRRDCFTTLISLETDWFKSTFYGHI